MLRVRANRGCAPDVRVEVVQRMMDRIGVSMPPEEFVYEVVASFQAAHSNAQAPGTVEGRLRRCSSYRIFAEALKQAGPVDSVLLYSCGDGLPGLPPDYIVSEWRRAWPNTPRVEHYAISTRGLWNEAEWPKGNYDVVVSLSQLHFIYNLDIFFEMTGACLRPGGLYIMAKEVNARYFLNPALQDELRQLRAENKQKRGRAGMDPGRYWRWLKRSLGMRTPVDRNAFDKANDRLRERIGAKAPLTNAEISRLVEIHRPTETLDGPQIGLNGFDLDHLAKNYLPEYRLEWSRTSNHMGFTHVDLLAPKWREREVELGREYPADGAYLSCCWRKG